MPNDSPMAVPGMSSLILGLALFLGLLLWRRQSTPKGYRRVPGPPGAPVVGNALQMGSTPHRQIRRWAHEYGELFGIRLGWENWVYVNSPEAIREIFDRQSASTSGRMPMPVAADVLSGGNRLLFITYGQQWRKLRTIVHKLLTPRASETYKPSQEFEAKQLIYDIAAAPDDERSFYMHVRRYATSVVLTSTYGRRVPVWDCEDVHQVYEVMREFSEAAVPGAYIADLFPPLARLPVCLQWWRPRAIRAYNRQKTIWMRFWTILRDQVQQGKAPECFVKHFMETDFESEGIDEVQASFVAGSMIEAGSETTSSAVNSCILYLSAHPKCQEIANEELSRVVGDERSPTFDDEVNLPYIRAMGKEILRIRPVTTIGSPHYTTSDVFYKDYYIAKDTVVVINQYALHFDPDRWHDPDRFDPSRYLNHPHKSGVYAAGKDAEGRDHFDFGAGRRICPGMHLAENSLFITLAKILWAFTIEPPLGPDGEKLPVDTSDTAYEEGVNTLPKPFRARFIARNEKRAETLREEWSRALNEGLHLGPVQVDAKGMVESG